MQQTSFLSFWKLFCYTSLNEKVKNGADSISRLIDYYEIEIVSHMTPNLVNTQKQYNCASEVLAGCLFWTETVSSRTVFIG